MHEIDDDFAIPIVRLWEHLLVPVQGEISDRQASELSADVLDAVHRTGATSLLIDVSGVAVMDSHLCATFARLAASARMMGVNSVISGLTPEIVMTLQTMGVELEDIHTTLSLEEALMMLGIGKLQPMVPASAPAAQYAPPRTTLSPYPATVHPPTVPPPPFGVAPPSPGAAPPGPFDPARAAQTTWPSPGGPPVQPAPTPPRTFASAPPFAAPAFGGPGHPYGQWTDPKNGDLDD